MTEAGYGALKALKAANPEMSHTEIVSAALIAMATNSAFQQPIQPKRIGKESLLILGGIVADAEAALTDTFRKIIRAKIDPVKKASLAEDVDTQLLQFKELRQTICREAGIPLSSSLTTDAAVAIEALREKKQETSLKYYQESYGNIIQLLERYRLDTFVPPEPPEQSLTTDFNP